MTPPVFSIEAARRKPADGACKGPGPLFKGISTRVQVWLENEEQCSYVKNGPDT